MNMLSVTQIDASGVASRRMAAPARDRLAEDKAMLRTAAELTRDLLKPRPAIYWTDLIASSLIGYGALLASMTLASTGWAVAAFVVAVLALYRAASFIHEVSHIKHSALPGFRTGWNALIGVPLLAPSFLYEGVHNLHHQRTKYGTAEDPEYLPLAHMKPWSVPLFVLVAALAPIGFLIRFGIMVPVGLVSPKLRAEIDARFSALAINPDFRRRPLEGEALTLFRRYERMASVWAIALVALTVVGLIPLKAFGIYLAAISVLMIVNQVRTLVAHLWENEGEAMSVTAQYLDSVNVPPPGMLPFLWAPVGLRYHALHHLLPGLPYHSLGEAHRRLSGVLEPASPFHAANYRGLPGLLARLVKGTFGIR